MDDVKHETLQQLVERRLLELGRRRGRSERLSLREVWQTLPADADGRRPISYELVRRVQVEGHTNISDRAADAIATMLDVAVGDVLKAAGQRPRLGRFELPRRADRLTDGERAAVLGIVDAILSAADADRDQRPAQSAAPRRAQGRSARASTASQLEEQLRARLAEAKSDEERAHLEGLLADVRAAQEVVSDPGRSASG